MIDGVHQMSAREFGSWRVWLIDTLIGRMGAFITIVVKAQKISDLLSLEESELIICNRYNIAFDFENTSDCPLIAL
jgi:hypothetical protein